MPLMVGTIPVYKGAPNVDNFVPPMSIIKVDDFASLEELAHYIKCVARRPRLYHYYTNWRNRTTARWHAITQEPHPLCRACQLVARDHPVLYNTSARVPRPGSLHPHAVGLQKPFQECMR